MVVLISKTHESEAAGQAVSLCYPLIPLLQSEKLQDKVRQVHVFFFLMNG